MLRSIGMSVKDIREHYDNEDSLEAAIALLYKQSEVLQESIDRIKLINDGLQEKIKILKLAKSIYGESVHLPVERILPDRQVIFSKFEAFPRSRYEFRKSVMELWRYIVNQKIYPFGEFGILFPDNTADLNQLQKESGVYFCYPFHGCGQADSDIRFVKGGKYLCFLQYGMPYETDFLFNCMDWCNEHGYVIDGDIIYCNLLETAYYSTLNNTVDFGELQIPIR